MLSHWRSSSYCNSGSVFVKISTPGICSTFLLDPYWSQKKRILYTPFFRHSIGWVEIFYLFIFIWEVRIRHWSRNLSQKFYRDGSEIQIDVSSHFDEAKSKLMYRRILMKRNPNRCIVAFWWSENQIDVSSHCDWAKFKLMYRRISRIRAKTSMPSLAIWKRRWVYRIPRWERRRVCRVLRLLSRAKMSISNLVIVESEDEYFESCE